MDVDAFQMTESNLENPKIWPFWLRMTMKKEAFFGGWYLDQRGCDQRVYPYDWLVRYPGGAIGVIKPDDFLAQFELVDEGDA